MHSKTPLSTGNFFKLTLRSVGSVYNQLFLYSFVICFAYYVLAVLFHLIENPFASRLGIILMGAWVIWLPLLASYLIFQEQTMLKKNPSWSFALKKVLDKFLQLVGALLALILIPSLIALLGIGLILLAHHFQAAYLDWGILGLSLIFIILFLNSRILTLLIVLVSPLDSSSSLEHSKTLTKSFFLRTFFRSMMPFLLIQALLWAPFWISPLLPLDQMTQVIALTGIALCLAMISPYLWGMMVVDLHDLEHIRLKNQPKKEHEIKKKIKPAPKAEIKSDDYF